VDVCEFGALEVVEKPDGRQVVEVTEALCKGCGSCAATCPSGAMEQKGFKSEQLLEAVEAAIA
jgi:heterodisulfide reductase subunit A